MGEQNYLYFSKQAELLNSITRSADWDVAKIEEQVRKGLGEYVRYLLRSIEALKSKEIIVPFERVAAGYTAQPQFALAKKNEKITVGLDNRKGWFAIEKNEKATGIVLIMSSDFSEEGENIEQEQIANWLFLFLPNIERKKHKIILVSSRKEYEALPVGIPATTNHISFTRKGETLELTNGAGQWEAEAEKAHLLKPAIEFEDCVLRFNSLPETQTTQNVVKNWEYLSAYQCWIGPANEELPPNFESLDSENDLEKMKNESETTTIKLSFSEWKSSALKQISRRLETLEASKEESKSEVEKLKQF